jgi:hypothetical protein
MFSESDARGSKRLLSDADTSEGEYPIVPPKASPWQVWCKYTELRYLFVSLMGSRFGSGIAEMAMMSIILAATIDSPQAVKTSMLGIPMASRGIVWASFALFGGIITDRYDNLKTMFLSDVCCIGSALLFLSLRPGMGVDTIKFLIPPLTVLHSVLGSPTYPAHKRWGSLLCEAHELDAVNGIVTTGALLGMAFGLGFGSVLAATFSTDVVFMIDATTYIVSAFSVYQIQCVYKARMDVVNPDWEIKQASERPSAPIGNCKTYLSFMMGGYQYCWQHKRFLLFYAITVSFFFPMVDTMLDVYLPEVATHMYGQDSATLFVGFMFLVECIGLAIMPHVATFVPTNTVGKRMVSQFVACVGMALCLTGVSFTPSDEDDVTTLVSVAYFGSLFVYGMAMCYTGLISTWWFQQSPPSVRGRVICIGHLAGSSSRFLVCTMRVCVNAA